MSESTASRDSSQDLEFFLSQVSESIVASDTSAATTIVKRVAAIAAHMCGEGLVVEYKTSISDVVTTADHVAERFVVEVSATLCPEDGILGEEGSAKEPQTGHTWVIDLVDGTYSPVTSSDY